MNKRPAKRSSLGVGKDIGGCIYLHKQYEHLLPANHLAQAKRYLYLVSPAFVYNVIKYDKKSHRITFFSSLHFDLVHEPAAGSYITIDTLGNYKHRYESKLWHHKWMFVGDDYTGFDVNESMARSAWWTSLPDVNRSKIGNPTYWDELMSKHGGN
jgi:hypothetical protein